MTLNEAGLTAVSPNPDRLIWFVVALVVCVGIWLLIRRVPTYSFVYTVVLLVSVGASLQKLEPSLLLLYQGVGVRPRGALASGAGNTLV
jgi:hypothetical protein